MQTDPADLAVRALNLARVALVIAGVVAVVCIGGDVREVLAAVATTGVP